MTGKPQRATRDGQAYLDLQNLARRQGRLTDELLQIYALEGFLVRLAASPHRLTPVTTITGLGKPGFIDAGGFHSLAT